MKALTLVSVVVLTLLLAGSCCSKKGACPAIQFDNIQLYNFSYSEVADSVTLIVYDSRSSFGIIKDSGFVKVERTPDSSVFRINLGNMKVDDDYALRVIKLNKIYRVSGFTGNKISCGKCFLRNNNQFGYELSGYRVNNRYYDFDGGISIVK